MSVLTVAIARPTSYIKGPDIASKSERTRQRYKTLLSGQKSLKAFGFQSLAVESSSALDNEADAITTQLRLATSPHQSHAAAPPSVDENMPESDVREVGPTDFILEPDKLQAGDSNELPIQPNQEDDDIDEEWEFDVEACQNVSMQKDDVRRWDVLQDQIKADLKKNGSTLPLSKVNQLLILWNFATLRLKGY